MGDVLKVEGLDVFVRGRGAQTLVMVHGWPDTHRLWDASVEQLAPHYRCVCFTLPGFEVGQARRAVSLEEMEGLLAAVIDAVSPVHPVTLLLHDWGCFFGYHFAMRWPSRVARIIGVDIGDVTSVRYRRSLSLKAKASIVGYQLWLAAAWRIGGDAGDTMTRFIARLARAPAQPETIHSGMNYPYDILWSGSHGSYRAAANFEPHCPMLFIYGSDKPFLFHSPKWAQTLADAPGCRVIALPTGHWVMTQAPQRFCGAVCDWLGQSPVPGATSSDLAPA